MALLAVLWTMSLVALIAAGFGGRTRTEVVIARNLVDAAQAEAVADGGLRLAAARVLGSEPALAPVLPMVFTIGDGEAAVEVVDEAGKLDLNAAAPDLLERLFAVAGMDASVARRLTTAILARRERLDPAFTMVDQLVSMSELPPGLFARLAPSLTVFTGERGASAAVAGADVRAALASGSAEARPLLLDDADLTPEESETTPTGQVFGLRSIGRLPNGATFVREAVVAGSRRLDIPIRILSWQRGRLAAAGGEVP